jgi:hypothetical protein
MARSHRNKYAVVTLALSISMLKHKNSVAMMNQKS